MKPAKIDIQLSPNCANCCIKVNGEDISNAVRSIILSQTAGETAYVTLELTPNAEAKLNAEVWLQLVRYHSEPDPQ